MNEQEKKKADPDGERSRDVAPAPKKKWWQSALDAIGNAIGEAKFGGDR
jgi:hypothetical protein